MILLLAVDVLIALVCAPAILWCEYLHSSRVRRFFGTPPAAAHRKLVLDLSAAKRYYLYAAVIYTAVVALLTTTDRSCAWLGIGAVVLTGTWVFIGRRTEWAQRQSSYRSVSIVPHGDESA